MARLNLISSEYISEKIREDIKNERLARLIEFVRHLDYADFDKAFVIRKTIYCNDMDDFFNNVVDKLAKIRVPSIYTKVIQSEYENLITLPEEDKQRYQVLILDYNDDKQLRVKEIKPSNEIDESELLALVGRHPFVDVKGWTITKVAFSDKISEIAMIGQQTWKDRGGDFDGDAALIILITLPKDLRQKYEVEVYKSEFDAKEYIDLPKIDSKAMQETEIKEIKFEKLNFKYIDNNKCLIYPATISHLQNANSLADAITTAILIASDFKIHWKKRNLIRATEGIMKDMKKEFEQIKYKNPKLYITLKKLLPLIHKQFLMILVPIMVLGDKINVDLYEACIRIYLKSTGPQIMGRIQKQLLSVAKTPDEIKRALDFVHDKQQTIIDLKKADHPLINYNKVLQIRKNLDKIDEIKDLYEKWKNTDRNWSKNRKELLFFGSENPDELDKLIYIIPKLFSEKFS